MLTGCATYRVDYDIGLYEVERPAQARERYGEQKITKVQEEGIEKYYFEDEMVQIAWIPIASPIASRMSFVLTNKTDHSIKIVWDEAAFVDTNGMSRRVMHSGVKYIDRNNPQPPSVVVRRGAITDDIIPSDNVVSSEYGGWSEEPLLPKFGIDAQALKTKAEKYSGKTYQVLLPLEIEGIINEYIFTFKINNVEVAAAQNAEAGEVQVPPKKVPLKQSLKSAGIFFGAIATVVAFVIVYQFVLPGL